MGIQSSSTKLYKNVNIKSNPRCTLAHHLRECRMDPFPSPTEHNIKWKVVEMGDPVVSVRCFLTGCILCDNSGVFVEKIEDEHGDMRLALRRIISPTETVTYKFRGLEDINLKEAVANHTLTYRLLYGLRSYTEHPKCRDTEQAEVSDFTCAMNFLLSLSKETVRDRLLGK